MAVFAFTAYKCSVWNGKTSLEAEKWYLGRATLLAHLAQKVFGRSQWTPLPKVVLYCMFHRYRRHYLCFNSQFSGDPVSIAFLVWVMIFSFVFFFV